MYFCKMLKLMMQTKFMINWKKRNIDKHDSSCPENHQLHTKTCNVKSDSYVVLLFLHVQNVKNIPVGKFDQFGKKMWNLKTVYIVDCSFYVKINSVEFSNLYGTCISSLSSASHIL